MERYETEAESFTKIIEDPEDPDILWLAARLMGLARFDKASETFTFYAPDSDNPSHGTSHPNLYEILHDSTEETIWLGGWYGGGLNRFDKQTERFTHYTHDPADPNTISIDAIASIYQDAEYAQITDEDI